MLTTYVTETTVFGVASVNSFGCESTGKAEVTAVVSDLPDFTFNDGSICENDEAGLDLRTLVDVQGGRFSGDGVTDNTFYPLQVTSSAVVVSYTVYTPFGCQATKQATIVVNSLPDQPIATGTFERIGPGNITVTVNSADAVSYQWYQKTTDGSYTLLQNEVSQSLTVFISETTTFGVVAFNAEGCETTVKTDVTAVVNAAPAFASSDASVYESETEPDRRTDVQEARLSSQEETAVYSGEIVTDENIDVSVLAYPNPLTDPVLNLEIPSTIDRQATVRIYSQNELLHQENVRLVKGNNSITIDAANLPGGFLIVMVTKEAAGGTTGTTDVIKVYK